MFLLLLILWYFLTKLNRSSKQQFCVVFLLEFIISTYCIFASTEVACSFIFHQKLPITSFPVTCRYGNLANCAQINPVGITINPVGTFTKFCQILLVQIRPGLYFRKFYIPFSFLHIFFKANLNTTKELGSMDFI